MKNRQHTPGPWVVYDDSNDGKTNRIEIVAMGKTVARIYHSVPKEDLPNALLIAAAPDLLEALNTWLKQYSAEEYEDCPEVVQTRAAIAKATGAA